MERFQAIAGTIRHELDSMLPEPIAPSPKPSEPPVPAPTRCTATTRKGSRCKNRARETGLCAVHARARAPVAADSEVERESEVERPAVAAKPDPVVAGVAGTPATAAAVLNRLPVLRPGKLRFDPPRIDARLAWPLAGSVAVVAAAVLIWSGLSTGDHGALGAGMVVDSDTDRVAALPADHSSFGAARGDTHDDGARSHGTRSHRGGLGSSGRGEPGASRRGEPASALVVAGGPGPDSGGDGATPASPSAPSPAPAPSLPSPEPAPAPSPEPAPAPTPAPSPSRAPSRPPRRARIPAHRRRREPAEQRRAHRRSRSSVTPSNSFHKSAGCSGTRRAARSDHGLRGQLPALGVRLA